MRAVLSQGEAAGLVLLGIGERAGLVAEELGFDQRVGQRPAVHRDERPAAVGAVVVNGARDQFLAGAAGALDQHRAAAFRHLGKDAEDLEHLFVLADNVLKRMLPAQRFLKFLERGYVLKGLNPSDDVTRLILQQGGAHADRDALLVGPIDVHRHVRNRRLGFDRAAQHAAGFAHVRPKDLEAVPADCLRSLDPGDGLGSAVEGRDAPIQIDREHTLGDAVQDQLVATLKGVVTLFFHGLRSSSESILRHKVFLKVQFVPFLFFGQVCGCRARRTYAGLLVSRRTQSI